MWNPFDFSVDQNMTPDQLAYKRAMNANVASGLGSADYAASGLVQMLTGLKLGAQNKKLNTVEQAGRQGAQDAISALYQPMTILGANPMQPGISPAPMDPNSPQGIASDAMTAIGQTPAWLRYSNTNATRNDPIDPALVSSMSFLGDMGITMDVISGGQEAAGEGGGRTGSTRHDHGKSADVDFYMGGRKLDWNNPADLPVLQQIVSTAKSNGITGIGAGDDYMGAGRFHIGFGDPAVWGAGGKSANAPQWLVEAYNGQLQGNTPQQVTGQMPTAEIFAAMNNPWTTPEQRAMLETMLQTQQNAPLDALNIQKAQQDVQLGQLELDAARQPPPPPEVLAERQALAGAAGLTPDMPEYQTYLLTGDLPKPIEPVKSPIADLEARAALAGLKPGTPEYQAFMLSGGKPADGMVIESDGQGGFRMVQGAGAALSKPFTEAQSKDVVFATRAEGALQALDPIAEKLTSRSNQALGWIPFGGGGSMQDPEYQVAVTAGNEFLSALLRKDSGAAITEEEQALYGKTYLPAPGDSPERLAYKAEARRRAIDAIKAGMSPAQIVAQETANAKTTGAAQFRWNPETNALEPIEGNP